MKEENKYYTPSESEFHIGFEYQSLTDQRMPELDSSWSNEEIRTLTDMIHHCTYSRDDDGAEYRVKSLDKQDIESFGFKQRSGYYSTIIPAFRGRKNVPINLIHTDKHILIYIKFIQINSQNLFSGECLNKSELQFILKRLNIV